jgi:hypothetical protein
MMPGLNYVEFTARCWGWQGTPKVQLETILSPSSIILKPSHIGKPEDIKGGIEQTL